MNTSEPSIHSPIIEAFKDGGVLRLNRDPHPDTTMYMVIEGAGCLVMFPKNGEAAQERPVTTEGRRSESPAAPDRDEHLRNAFDVLRERVGTSPWILSPTPFTDLKRSFEILASQEAVAVDVDAYLDLNPDVENATEMLFTSVAMSARADWRKAPLEFRGVVARGWFLGRWVPTFLVLDGPILRFLKSSAFRRQDPSVSLLRSVRRFFDTNDFMRLRNAFAHWSFTWLKSGDDSIIVGTEAAKETVRATRGEADAFHIVTFGLIEAINDVFLERRRRTAVR